MNALMKQYGPQIAQFAFQSTQYCYCDNDSFNGCLPLDLI
jgi:hypothetical protein